MKVAAGLRLRMESPATEATRVLHGQLGKPQIQNAELVLGWIDKRHAHSQPFLNVNDPRHSREAAVIARDAQLHHSIHGKRVQNVDVTTLPADFRNAPGHLCAGGGFDDFRGRDKRVSWDSTALSVRRSGAGWIRCVAHDLAPRVVTSASHTANSRTSVLRRSDAKAKTAPAIPFAWDTAPRTFFDEPRNLPPIG